MRIIWNIEFFTLSDSSSRNFNAIWLIIDKNIKLEKTKGEIDLALNDIKVAGDNNKTQKAMQQQITDMPDPIKFVSQKNDASELKNCVKNWERKIEIAEVAAKKAKQILKNA